MTATRSSLLLLAACLAAAAELPAQRLLGLGDGVATGPAADVTLETIDPRFCDVPSSCIPMPGGSPIGGVYNQDGGVAIDLRNGTVWFTAGPTLHHVRRDCTELYSWAIPGNAWTGLTLDARGASLIYTTATTIAEVAIPDPATAPTTVDLTGAVIVAAPTTATTPLTGVELDPTTGRVWVTDAGFQVFEIDRPTTGTTVHSTFSVSAYCGGAILANVEGIALDPATTAPGHPTGILYLSDGRNRVLQVDRLGGAITCCAITGLSRSLAGLAFVPPSPARVYVPGCTTRSAPPPRLLDITPSTLGQVFVLGVRGAPSQGIAVYLLSPTKAKATIACGVIGLPPDVLKVQGLDAMGATDWVLPLPPIPAARGIMLNSQAIAADASANLELTPAIEFTLQ